MEATKQRVVAKWIFLGVGMLVVQVLLGGITRLTGSGLSITEWKPVIGTVPPINEAEWQAAFGKYRQIAQYKYLNQHFTLSNFKFIFFWEWFHRLWARLIGVVFLLPFIFFIVKDYFKKWMVAPLVILFLLGILQGAVGWIMVKSGLNDNDVYVSHIRLSAHFMAAMVLICYTLLFGMKLTLQPVFTPANGALYKGILAIILLVCVQLVYGAFMAGTKAAAAAPTWPSINGDFIPSTSDENIIQNKILIHFIHRTLAYIIGIGILIWWVKAKKVMHAPVFKKASNISLLLVFAQIALGIFTVVSSRYIVMGTFGGFEWLALLHQLIGMLLLLSLVADAYLLNTRK